MTTAVWTVLLLVAGGLLGRFGEQLFDAALQMIGRIRGRRQRSLAGHFRGVPLENVDLLVFTVTVRPQVPITDALYFEFVKKMLRNDQANRATLVMWYPTPVADPLALERFRDYLNAMFSEVADRFTIVDGPNAATNSNGPIPPRFWSALKQLSSPEYYAWVRNSGLRVRKLKHMNQARPGEEVLKGMVAHTIHNSIVLPTIIGHLREAGRGKDGPLSLAVLFWEVEVDRLAVYYDLYDGDDTDLATEDLHLHPISGRTISGRLRKAGDNHDPRAAIAIRANPASQLGVIESKPRREVRAYLKALECILEENYGVTNPRNRWPAEGKKLVGIHYLQNKQNGGTPSARRSTFALIYALSLLQSRVYSGSRGIIQAGPASTDQTSDPDSDSQLGGSDPQGPDNPEPPRDPGDPS